MDNKIFIIFSLAAVLAVSCGKEPSGDNGKVPVNSKVIMTEINGSEDFIELYNSGSEAESLEGFKIRRMRLKDGVADAQTIWEGMPSFREGMPSFKIAAGERLVLAYAEGKTDNLQYPRNLQNPLSSKKNMFLWLQDPAGNRLSEFRRGIESIGWGEVRMHKAEIEDIGLSYSLSGSEWKYAVPSKGSENAEAVGTIDQTMLYVSINEIDLEGSKVELYNYGDKDADISGFELRWSRIRTDGTPDNQTIWTAPLNTVLSPGDFLTVSISTPSLSAYQSRNIHLRLRNPNAFDCTGEKIVWDDFKRGVEGSGWTKESLSATSGSYARVPDGTGNWYLQTATVGSRNGVSTATPVPDVKVD